MLAELDPSKLDPGLVLADMARANYAGGGGKLRGHESGYLAGAPGVVDSDPVFLKNALPLYTFWC